MSTAAPGRGFDGDDGDRDKKGKRKLSPSHTEEAKKWAHASIHIYTLTPLFSSLSTFFDSLSKCLTLRRELDVHVGSAVPVPPTGAAAAAEKERPAAESPLLAGAGARGAAAEARPAPAQPPRGDSSPGVVADDQPLSSSGSSDITGESTQLPPMEDDANDCDINKRTGD